MISRHVVFNSLHTIYFPICPNMFHKQETVMEVYFYNAQSHGYTTSYDSCEIYFLPFPYSWQF
jgi:hypothetical protein